MISCTWRSVALSCYPTKFITFDILYLLSQTGINTRRELRKSSAGLTPIFLLILSVVDDNAFFYLIFDMPLYSPHRRRRFACSRDQGASEGCKGVLAQGSLKKFWTRSTGKFFSNYATRLSSC